MSHVAAVEPREFNCVGAGAVGVVWGLDPGLGVATAQFPHGSARRGRRCVAEVEARYFSCVDVVGVVQGLTLVQVSV